MPLGRLATLPITLLVQVAASAAILAPAVAAPQLLLALDVGAVAVGVYIAIVYVAAMLSSQCGVVLVRRLGAIRTSQTALACSAIGLLLMAAPHLAAATVGALMLGIGYGPITPASSEMLARTTPPERYALVFSVKQTGVPLGGAVAGLLIPRLLDAGIAGAMVAMGALCLLGIAVAQALRAELDAARDRDAPWPSPAQIVQPVVLVLRNDALRRIALCTLVFSAVQVSLTTYLVSFLTADLRWTLVAAGAALSLAQAGGAVGRIGWGWIADGPVGANRTLLALSIAMALAGAAMTALGVDTPHAWVLLLVTCYGATAVGWNGVFLATVAKLVQRPQAAAATSGCLFFTYLGVVLGLPSFGLLGDATGSLGIAFGLLALPLAWTIWALQRRGHEERRER